MNQQAAINLITQTFDAPFDEQRFTNFVRNLFNQIDESKNFAYQGPYISDAFKEHVRQYKRLGTYTDPEGMLIDILIVRLKKESALDRARTMQRNFVASYLRKRGEKDAAMVAYYSDGQPDWRFSLVKMEYDIDFSEGKLTAKETLTPARRYSFLVGQNEPNHTAQQQLVPILREIRHNPTLSQLEAAFNIESVTKEFFEKYKALFLNLKEELDGLVSSQKAVKAEFERAGISTANFAKKLLGQIVFLYFLQKKGWLGVVPGQAWGSGPKGFLRGLFEKQEAPKGHEIIYSNFFNDVLEPLFYEALAIERPGNLYPRLNCSIPFLNGGLFEPVGDYNWQGVDILLNNERFEKIFQTFDLFNFTVREDEPLEKEVAVDPEMLGKVFENLLDVTDRKSKGAFYTPREIVHYMCQESLINYLDSKLNAFLPRADIDAFIRKGEFGLEHDAAKASGTESYQYQLPQTIRHNATAIDTALANIKICDPAIGSGAFPVGLMQEIVKARTVLTNHLASSSSQGSVDTQERTPYTFKRHTIEESIYGVDIDRSAVDIAKLRLWLSLVVDEESYDHIQPLPNLDYKIVCGNALLGVQKDVFNHIEFEEIEQLKPQYLAATDPGEKRALKSQIETLIAELTHGNAQFDFEIYFSEVFHHNGGFDVVIGNPPYVRHERIKAQKKALKKAHPNVYQGMADLYVYFYAQGMSILHPKGFLAFITSNKFMRAGYGKKLRQFLSQETTPQILIDFGDLPVFDATAYPCIVITQKSPTLTDNTISALTVETVPQIKQITTVMAQHAWAMPQHKALTSDGWQLEPPEVLNLLDKLRQAGTPLGDYVKGRFYRGVLTGYNKAFVIDRATRDQLITEHPSSAEIIKPFLRGRDVKRWAVDFAGQYLIKIESSQNAQYPWSGEPKKEAEKIFAKSYPAIYAHFQQHRQKLIKRYDQGHYYWELRACTYWQEFKQTKIAYPNICKRNEFAWDEDGYYTNQKAFIIPNASKYLLGVLNSSVVMFLFDKTLAKLQNGFYEPSAIFMKKIPIVAPPTPNPIEPLVTRILESKKANSAVDAPFGHDISALQAEIDQLVYQLYGLTTEEVAIVEASKKKARR